MWNNTGGGFDGGFDGGFANNSQFASPGGAGDSVKKERKSQTIIPVSIRQILDSPEDTIKVENVEAHLVVIVGVIRSVDVSSTKILYTIEDSTGTIETVQWLEQDEEGQSNKQALMEYTYCKVIGSVRSYAGKRNIMCFCITPITDLNFLTTHILEVIHTPYKLAKIEKMQSRGGGMGVAMISQNMGESLSNSFVGMDSNIGSGGGKALGLSGTQCLVYDIIHANKTDCGASKKEIKSNLKTKIPAKEIDSICEFLSGEGHVYSSIDDEHFRPTDS